MPQNSPRHLSYLRWFSMVRRCTRPTDPDWKNYGGRGITVCPEWLDFEIYYADIGDCPAPGLTLDRIDNDGNYEAGNMRWATRKEQRANRRYDHNTIKTHCPQDHPYDEANTHVTKEGKRTCRACSRDRMAQWRERMRSIREEPSCHG